MPRLPERVVAKLQPTSSSGARLTAVEVADTTVEEAHRVATQAIDVVENQAALSTLAHKLQGEALVSPLNSLNDVSAGRRWLSGAQRLDARSSTDDVRVLQRALMKIGAHHPQGRAQADLLLLPYGADGSLGPATLKAVDVALRLAGKPELTPAASHLPLGKEVALALEGLLLNTLRFEQPVQPQRPVFDTSPSVPQRVNLFGATARPVTTTSYEEKWTGVLSRIAQEQVHYRAGDRALTPAAAAWLREVDELKTRDPMFQLNSVNRIVNEYRYISDDVTAGRDKWSTPLEFFARPGGDCEDYAITKYVSLLRLGVDASRMRLVVVLDRESNVGHAVLAVDMPDATYILDNQTFAPTKHDALRMANGELRYMPGTALSATKRWSYTR